MRWPDLSSFNPNDPNWLAAVVGFLVLVGGLGTGLYRSLHWLWRHTVYLDDNFRIMVFDSLAPDFNAAPPSVRAIPHGASELLLAAYCKYKFKVKRVDFRILDEDYQPTLRFTPGFPANVEITALEDIYDGGLDLSQTNGIGGMEGEYRTARALARGQGLYFKIRIETHIPDYRGHISFRAQNEDGERSHTRYAFWVDPKLPRSALPLLYPLPSLANPPPGWEVPIDLWKSPTK